MYTDPDGRVFGIDDLIVGVIGGVINLGVNIFNGNLKGNFWQALGKGAAAFGSGFAAGALATYGPVGWTAGGAIVGGTNAWLGGATSAKDIAMGAGVGVMAGVAGGAVGSAVTSVASPLLNSISSPVLRGATGGVIGGGTGGYAGGFTGGLITTGDIGTAKRAGLNGLWLGAGIGGIVGAGTGYKYALDNKINPWNGKPNAIKASPQQTPHLKGQIGVERAEQELLSQGAKLLSREVTLEVNGVKVRVDVAADFNGEIHLIEVKNGPSAGFTPNQKIAYPQMQGDMRTPIIPRGANAAQIPQWQVGQPTTSYMLKIIRY
jgi:hypothetical protein